MKKKRCLAITAALTCAAAAVPLSPAASPFLSASAEASSVYINEICTQNKQSLTDSYGSQSDWIELYNDGETTVDLSGYGLSDSTDTPFKWTFPDRTLLGAKEYLIVFASKDASTTSELHTGFSLSKNGETLLFSNAGGAVLEQIDIPTLGEDATYGRIAADSTLFEIMSATPGAVNTAVVPAPRFSAASGFYGTDLSLSLSATGNVEIYFTTDGSDPTNSKTAQKYTTAITVQDRTSQPNLYSAYTESENSAQSISRGCGYKQPTFLVDKATVVRAAAKNANGLFSAVTDQTYFVTTGNLAQYKNGTVISLVTNPDNLFDPETGIYVTGNQFMAWRNSPSYNPSKNAWDTDNICNYFSKGKAWERQASVTVFENGTVSVAQGMGIRVKGASTRNNPQKSFNLYARSEYGASKIETALLPDNYDRNGNRIEKYDSISLRSVPEETRLRDSFAQGLLHDREHLTTADMKPCIVFLNGEYWGLYQMTEKLSDYFIESNYDIPKEDVAMIKSGELEEGTQETFDSFFDFADAYSRKDLTDAANYQAVCDFIDLDTMLEHYAAGLYLGTFDWPNYNYGIWKSTGSVIDGNPYSDGKWRFITYDLDYTMGVTYGSFNGVQGYAYDNFLHMDKGKNEGPTNLFVQLLKNETFRNKFVAVYCDYANDVLSQKRVSAQLQAYNEKYTDLLANTQLRWWGFYGGTPDSLISYYKTTYQNKTLSDIRTFFNERASYTLEDMRSYLSLQGTLQTLTLSASGNGSIRLNSIVPDLTTGDWSGKYYSDMPVTLTALPDQNASFTGWSGAVTSDKATITVTLSEAMRIQANFEEKADLPGDVNADGAFNIADVVMLQKWLLQDGTQLTDWEAGDLVQDQKLNAFDFCAMKRALLR